MARSLKINLTVDVADDVTEEQLAQICQGPSARLSSREQIILDGRQVVLDWGHIAIGNAFDWVNVDAIHVE